MEINPPKTVCGCPCGGGVIRNGNVSNPLTLWNANNNKKTKTNSVDIYART